MIKINGYFTDGCVIQADSEFSIAGKTAPLAEVRADLCEKETLSFCVRADENGDFSVLIPPIKGGLSTYSLIFYVDGVKEKTIRDVVFGDVWLGAGQSNLELKLKYLSDCDKATEEFKNSAFRFADLPNTKSAYNGAGFFGLQQEDGEPLAEVKWNTPDDKSAALETAGFSFLFAGEMQKHSDYPVGVFNVAVGGSNITHWLPSERFDNFPAFRSEIKVCDGKTEAGSLYYEKIRPLKGLAFRGVVWYLGESVAWTGAPTCAEYPPLLIELIDLYRDLLRGPMDFLLMDIGIEGYDEFSVNFVNEANSIAQKARNGVIRCPLFDLSQKWLIPDGKGTCHPIHLVEKREHAGRAADLCRLNFIENKPARCPEISSVDYTDGKAFVRLSDCVRIFSSDGRDLFGFALNLGLDRDPAVAFHASYALERAFFIAPEAFGRHIGHFVRNYLAIVNPSACRHYSKMMAWLLDRRRIELTDSQRQQVAEATFDRLIDPSVRPAVKVWSMEILDSLSAELPWVEEQLYDTICWLMRDDGPALRNRGTKICRRIRARRKTTRR